MTINEIARDKIAKILEMHDISYKDFRMLKNFLSEILEIAFIEGYKFSKNEKSNKLEELKNERN